MSTDLLIERLRLRRLDGTPAAQDMAAAADEIERLRSLHLERTHLTTKVIGERDKLAEAARELIDQADLTCMRANEEISVAEGCPCPVCVLRRLSLCGLSDREGK